MPTKGSAQSAGHDLHATETKTLQPGEHTLTGTGLQMQCNNGMHGRTAPRSGLATRHSMQTLGGVIDRDFRGDLQVILHNTDRDKEFKITTGDRITQLIIKKTDETPLMPTEDLEQTSRATSGRGSQRRVAARAVRRAARPDQRRRARRRAQLQGAPCRAAQRGEQWRA